jgi:hypothetical protein
MAKFWDQKARLPFPLHGKDSHGDIEDGNPPNIENRPPHHGIPLQGDIEPFCGEFPIRRGNIARGEGCTVNPIGPFPQLFRPFPPYIKVALPGEQRPVDNGSHLCLEIQFQTIACQKVSPLPQYHVTHCHHIIGHLVQLYPVRLEGKGPSGNFDMPLGNIHPRFPIVAQGVAPNMNRSFQLRHRYFPLLAGRRGGKQEKVTEGQGKGKRGGIFGHQNEFKCWHRGIAFWTSTNRPSPHQWCRRTP